MSAEKTDRINEKLLSKKYQTNVIRLIKAWKKGLSDFEVSRETGIDPVKLKHIKTDIEMAHRKLRLARKKPLIPPGQAPGQRHIFFNPFM